MLVLTWIRKLYKTLSADASPTAIALATSIGLMAGFLPINSGAFLVLLLALLIFRIQLSATIGVWFLASIFRLALAPILFVPVGEYLLENDSLREFWITVHEWPIVPWLGLEFYAILGGLFWGLIFGIAAFIPVRFAVIAYRKWAHEKVSNNKFFKWLTGFWITKVLRFVLVG